VRLGKTMNNPIKNLIEDIKAFCYLKKRNMLKYGERPQSEIPKPGYVKGTEYQIQQIHYGLRIPYRETITNQNILHEIEVKKKKAIDAVLSDAKKHIVISEIEDFETKDIMFEFKLLIGEAKK
jgi:hypothetical protein